MSVEKVEKSVRLAKAAKELNVGTSTLVDYLKERGFAVDNDINAKLSPDMYSVLFKQFASDKKTKDKVEQLKEQQREARAVAPAPMPLPGMAPPPPKPMNTLTAEELKSRVLAQEPPSLPAKPGLPPPPLAKAPLPLPLKPGDIPSLPTVAPKLEAAKASEAPTEAIPQPAAPAAEAPAAHQAPAQSQPPQPPQPQEPATTTLPEAPAPAEVQASTDEDTPRLSGLKVVGKIDLDTLNSRKSVKRGGKPDKTADTSNKTGKQGKAAAPAAQIPSLFDAAPPATAKAAEPASQAVAPTSPAAAPQTPATEAPQNTESAPATADLAAQALAGTTTEAADTPAPNNENEIVRASDNAPRLSGLKIVGRIDLPAPAQRGPRRDDASSTDSDSEAKRKRKRKRKVVGNNTMGGQLPQTGTAGGALGAVNVGAGRSGNQRRGAKKDTKEVNQQQVDTNLRSTLAEMGRGAKRFRQKVRRDRRQERTTRREAMELEMLGQENVIEVTEFLTANELSNVMDIPVNEVIAKCLELGMFVSINQRIDSDVIQLIAEEFGFEVVFLTPEDQFADLLEEEDDDPATLVQRWPIVTVMGHVDHGKTSLLDYIRKANVTAGEAGGITQHIGSYSVDIGDGRQVSFLDTPGHEAFTAMRARGAKVTDLAIIVIAADDQVMPQTREAINHAQAAGVPMIIAINKIDKPGAQPDKIREQLSGMNLLVEEWGGKVPSQEISAKSGLGIAELLDKVWLEAEILELKANPAKRARGTVIEAMLDKGRGVVANILVQDGTLKVGDVVIANQFYGRVKAMFDQHQKRIQSAGPSTPLQILGLDGVPQAGDHFIVMAEEREARELANKRRQLFREQSLRMQKQLTLEEIARRSKLGDYQELNLIVKADVDGSAEALADSLLKLSTDVGQVNILLKGVGQITETDVNLASASDAIIVGFQVRPSSSARKLAEHEGVEIRLYSVIYDAINEIKDALEGLLAPKIEEEITGTVEVRETFKITKVGTIAGCMVTDGKVERNSNIRLIRDGVVVYTGKIAALKRFKDDAREVASGYECGLQIENFNDIKVGDIIECYSMKEVKRTL